MSSKITRSEKFDIHARHVELSDSKSSLAREYGVSTRSIGRYIDEIENEVNENKANAEVKAKKFRETLEEIDSVNDDIEDDEDFEDEDDEDDDLNEEGYDFVMTPTTISISYIDQEGDDFKTITINEEQNNFDLVKELIVANDLESAFIEADIRSKIQNIHRGRVWVYPEQNRLEFRDDDGNVGSLSGSLINRVLNAQEDGDEDTIESLMAFANRLVLNPSEYVVNELYDFLEADDIAINSDGMVVCFKRVREDMTDCFTGKFDNRVGQTPSVPRNQVDQDSRVTCSRGLHVCSYAYLGFFGGERVIKVLVDPKDFVSIPEDYFSYTENGAVKAKARICRYHVVEDITESVVNYERQFEDRFLI